MTYDYVNGGNYSDIKPDETLWDALRVEEAAYFLRDDWLQKLRYSFLDAHFAEKILSFHDQ